MYLDLAKNADQLNYETYSFHQKELLVVIMNSKILFLIISVQLSSILLEVVINHREQIELKEKRELTEQKIGNRANEQRELPDQNGTNRAKRARRIKRSN